MRSMFQALPAFALAISLMLFGAAVHVSAQDSDTPTPGKQKSERPAKGDKPAKAEKPAKPEKPAPAPPPAQAVKPGERTHDDHVAGQPIGKPRLTQAELEAEYAQVEQKSLADNSDTRPGLAPWSQVQGADLVWPAKYYLPWPAGESHAVYQCWNGANIGPPKATHMKAQNFYAWDFNILRGQNICAARDGKVKSVVCDKDNELDNTIIIEHADGENSVYSHVGKDTAKVEVGERVLRGKAICEGSNQSEHLHFVIWKQMKDMPCRFIDHPQANGVPQYMTKPVSGNTGVDEALIAQIKEDYKKGEAAFQAQDYQAALNHFRRASKVEVAIDEYEQAKARIDEVRAAMMKTVDDVRELVKAQKFKEAEDKLKELKKKYGEDEALKRIQELNNELKKDPAFRVFVAKSSLKALEDKAKQYERDSKFVEAKDTYQKIVDLTDGLDDSDLAKAGVNAKKKVRDLEKAAIFDEMAE